MNKTVGTEAWNEENGSKFSQIILQIASAIQTEISKLYENFF